MHYEEKLFSDLLGREGTILHNALNGGKGKNNIERGSVGV
jgi:hypothetical protein